jgi:dTDP-4-amino-4,6-dideoxygalactose transaminase
MDQIQAIAEKHNLVVIEDAAQAVNANYNGRALGSLGQLGCYSFHETKNYACGEGGALCINDPKMVERAEIIREKGTNRSRFIRGQVDKYTWVDVGGSHLPSELAMAFLYGQLEQMDLIQHHRRVVYERYCELLKPFADKGVLRLPVVPANCQQNYHVFYILTNDSTTRNELLNHMRSQRIGAVFHYVPLHTAPMGQSYGYSTGDLPVTEELHARLIRLPFYGDLTIEDQDRVVDQLHAFFPSVERPHRPLQQPAKRAA